MTHRSKRDRPEDMHHRTQRSVQVGDPTEGNRTKRSASGVLFGESSLDGVGDGSSGGPFLDGVAGDPSVPDVNGSGSAPSPSS